MGLSWIKSRQPAQLQLSRYIVKDRERGTGYKALLFLFFLREVLILTLIPVLLHVFV